MDKVKELKKQMELDGRRKLTTAFPTINWMFTTEQYAPHDAATQRNDQTIIVEIKTRTFPTWQYNTCFLELNKLIALKSLKADKIMYVAHYSNNKTATWDITNINDPSNSRIMNDKTAEKTGKQLKDVIELKLSDADIRYTSTGIKTTQYNEKLNLFK